MRTLSVQVILLSLFLAENANGHFNAFKGPLQNEMFSQCLSRLANKLWDNYTSLAFLQKNDDISVYIPNQHFILTPNIQNGCRMLYFDNYIVVLRYIEELGIFIRNLIEAGAWDLRLSPRAKFLVITPNSNVSSIFKYLWSLDLVNIILVSTDGEIKIFASCPHWDVNECGKNAVVKEYSCKKFGDLAFFGTPKSFKNCYFAAALLTKVAGPLFVSTQNNFSGLLVEPLKLTAKHLELNLVLSEASELRQKQFFSAPQVIRDDIISRNQDTYIGFGWRLLKSYEILEPSDVIMYDDNFWIVVKPARKSNLQELASIFHYELWMAIISFYISFSVLCYFLGQVCKEELLQTLSKTFVMMCQVTLNTSVSRTPRTDIIRVLFFIYAVYSLHISDYFQGKLISTLTVPTYEEGLKTFQDLVNADGITPLLTVSSSENFDRLSYPKFFKKLKNLSIPVPARVPYVVKNKNVSLPTYSAYLNYDQNVKDKIKVLGQNYLFNLEAIYCLRKGHPFLPSFNLILNRITESGFHIKWRSDLKLRKFQSDDHQNQQVLSLKVLTSPFYILLFGCATGFLILIVEIIHFKF